MAVVEKASTSERVGIVTGAARGQGLAIVQRLLAEGFQVIACDLPDADLSHAQDAGAFCQELDVTSSSGWAELVAAADQRFGRIDVLINNAGVLRRIALEDEEEAAFTRTWEVNCLGPFLGVQAVLPYLLASDSAVIVNTCSTAALIGFSHHAAYSSSKWALRGLTQSLALELGPKGIRVNAVMPGAVETPMLSPETVQRIRDSGATVVHAEEVAEVVIELVTSSAHGEERVVSPDGPRRST